MTLAAGNLISKTENFIFQSERTLSFVKDYETSARGFVIANNDEFLEPAKNTKANIKNALLDLRKLAGNNGSQLVTIDSLDYYINKRLIISDLSIRLRRDSGLAPAMLLVSSGVGKRCMDTIRMLQKNLAYSQNALLARRYAAGKRAIMINRVVMLSILLIFFIVLVILFWQAWFNLKDYSDRQKQVNATLNQLAQTLIDAQKIAHLGSWEWDILSNEEKWSDEQCRIFGYEPGITKISHELFLHAIHPNDRNQVEMAINESITKRKPFTIRFRILRPDGEPRNVNMIGEIYADQEKAVRMVGTLQDITRLIQKEKEKENIAVILEKTNKVARVGWWEADIVSGKRIWSTVTKEILEVAPNFEPLNDLEFSFVQNINNRDVLEKLFSRAVLFGTPYDITLTLTTAKGNNILVRVIGEPEFEAGQCIRVFGVLQDISFQKELMTT